MTATLRTEKLSKQWGAFKANSDISLTFTPGAPPMWTWLVRYYEPGWNHAGGLGPFKMALDAACLFLASAMLAPLWTAEVYYHWFR